MILRIKLKSKPLLVIDAHIYVFNPVGTQFIIFFFSSRRRHTRSDRDWSSDVCSSDLRRSTSDFAIKPPCITVPRAVASGSVGLLIDERQRGSHHSLIRNLPLRNRLTQIGRASCRERV